MSLVVDAVSKSFGPVRALDRISFTVEPGRIFGLLGANGAGKTTCMRIVLDILRADSGSVTWEGQPNDRLPRRTWGEAGVLLYGQRPTLRMLVRAAFAPR